MSENALANVAPPIDGRMALMIAQGDYSRASEEQRAMAIIERCRVLDIDPRAAPFQFINAQNRTIMYATASCAAMLTLKHKVSVQIIKTERIEDLIVVSARASSPDGRVTDDIGAVVVGSLKGDSLANAMMKANTKAHRRVVMKHCGLSMPDETELETIPGVRVVQNEAPRLPDSDAGEVIGAERAAGLKAAMERRGIPPESLDAWLADKGYADRVRDLKVADFPVEIGHAMADWIKAAGAAMKPVAPAEPAKFTATSPRFWQIKAEAAYKVKYPDRNSTHFDAHALNYPVHDPEKQPADAVKGWKDMLSDIETDLFDETPPTLTSTKAAYKQGSLTDADLGFN